MKVSEIPTYRLDYYHARAKIVKSVARTKVVRKYMQLKHCKLEYENFKKLHELWKEYMREAVGTSNFSGDDRLLKIDLHGCVLHVTKATNPTQEGLHGIVVRETRNAILILRPQLNRLVTIPKQGSVFHFVLNGHVYTIFGDNFRTSAVGRCHRKYKTKAPIPDFLDSF